MRKHLSDYLEKRDICPFFIESGEKKVSQCSALLLSHEMIECHDFVHFVNMTVIQLDGSV